jgi:hypothetical protein
MNINWITPTSWMYLLATVFSILFSLIYLSFVPGVFEWFLVFLFMVPFTLGWIPSIILDWNNRKEISKKSYTVSTYLYHSGVTTLTVYTALQGIYNIALATVIWQPYFLWTGIIFLCGSGFIRFVFKQ